MNKSARGKLSEWRPEGANGPGYPGHGQGCVRAVAIGNFDGAHLGHAAVAAQARAEALRLRPGERVEVFALTFEPHPRRFFQPERPLFRLTPCALRGEALGRIGFDGIVILPFDHALADLPAERFVKGILADRLAANVIAVGADFHFGKGRAGTPDFLVREAARLGIAVSLVEPLAMADGAIISSSAIREALAAGDVARANAMLGYPFLMIGTVIHGAKRGRELNYPTANIALDPDCGLAHGIYAVRAVLEGQSVNGVASFGRRPHFDNGAPLLEVHLFDFAGDLYGKTLRVGFHAYLRGEAKFESLDALIAQMDRDSAEARRILAASP
jgi:riboflavin kinase/FMN adenylyltransferase